MRKELRDSGFTLSFTAHHGQALLVLAIVILAGVAGRYAETLGGASVKWNDAVSSVLTIGAFFVAYRQWKAAREEASLDKYYERLDLANRRKEALDGIDKYPMYVFTELDNLEYMLERYKLGYTSTAQAFRCLLSFRSRCREQGFKDSALHWVAEAGYHETTKDVVNKISRQV